MYSDSFAEAASISSRGPTNFSSIRMRYLEQIRRLKEAVGIPVIASLNGMSHFGLAAICGDDRAGRVRMRWS